MGSDKAAAIMLMQKGTITITKEKSPNCAANMLRMKTRLIRKCAPEVATGPDADSA